MQSEVMMKILFCESPSLNCSHGIKARYVPVRNGNEPIANDTYRPLSQRMA